LAATLRLMALRVAPVSTMKLQAAKTPCLCFHDDQKIACQIERDCCGKFLEGVGELGQLRPICRSKYRNESEREIRQILFWRANWKEANELRPRGRKKLLTMGHC